MANLWYFNWEIAGNPWSVYSELKNRDIAPVPYTNRQSLSEYFLRKRESYRAIRSLNQIDVLRWYRFTDVWINDNRWCGNCDWECDCCKFYYWVSADRTRYAIVRTWCEDCNPTVIKCGSRCPCAEMKFFKVYGRNSPILNNTSTKDYALWEIWNENTFWRMLVDKDISKLTSWVRPWDYVQITWITNDGNAICWWIRQIVNVEDYEVDDTYAYRLQLSTPWSGIAWTEHLTWAQVISFTEVDRVPWFVTSNWIQTIVWCASDVWFNCSINWEWLPIWDNLCEIGSEACIVSAHPHNWTLTYLNDKWYSYYGWVWFDSNQPNNNNVQFVGTDKIDSTSFKNFIINFWKRELNCIVFDETGSVSYLKELETNWVWIKNKWARAQMDWWLFFVWNDNRIYWASIVSNWLAFDIDLKDITTNIRWHMELIQEDDEVYLSADAWILYIFINTKSEEDNRYPNKTKILKYYKDYEMRWPWHEVKWEVITWAKYWQFMWESIYNYCGRDWDGESNIAYEDEFWEKHFYGKWYEAIAEWLLYGMNQHWMQSADGMKLNMFRRHKLLRWVLMLWWWVYTDATTIEISRYNKYRRNQYQTLDKDNPWIENWYKAWNCQPVTVWECFAEWFSACDNIKNPCEWSKRNCESRDKRCKCEWKKREYDKYLVCYDDSAYELSPIETFEITFDDEWAKYHQVRFISWYKKLVDSNWRNYQINDVWYFWWFIIETDTQNSMFSDIDAFSVWCCAPTKECPLNSCL